MANSTMLNLPVAVSVDGTENAWIVQSGTDKRVTLEQIANAASAWMPSNLNYLDPMVVTDAFVVFDTSEGDYKRSTFSNAMKGLTGLTALAVPNLSNDYLIINRAADGNTYKINVSAFGMASGNLPAGGTRGQLLAKNSSTNYDAIWSSDIFDGNGNTEISFTSTASAVNYLRVTNNATGSTPSLSSDGSDANVSIRIASKAASSVFLRTDGVDRLTIGSTGVATLSADVASTNTSTGTLVLSGASAGIGLLGAIFAGGNVNAAALVPTGSSVPANGLYLPAANTVSISTNTTERLRIDSVGAVQIGAGGTTTGYSFSNIRNITGAVSSHANVSSGVIQSDVTTQASGYLTLLGVQNAVFTLPTLYHYRAAQGTFGGSATITNQYGFAADSNLTGAGTNYGFWTDLAASGAARFAYYSAGSAPSLLTGILTLASSTASTSTSTGALVLTGASGGIGLLGAIFAGGNVNAAALVPTGSTVPANGMYLPSANAVAIATNTTIALSISSAQVVSVTAAVASSSTSTGALVLSGASAGLGVAGAIFAGGAITAAAHIPSGSSVPTNGMYLPTTNNVSFATATTERMRIDSAGNVQIGAGATTAGRIFSSIKQMTGAVTSYANATFAQVQSDVTTAANGFFSSLSVVNASFTLPAVYGFRCIQGSFGASATVTQQFGFSADSTLIGAGTNYGFHSLLAASGATRYAFYGAGTAPSLFAGVTSFTVGTASTSTTTGSVVVTGGVGVSGAIYSGGLINSAAAVAAYSATAIPAGGTAGAGFVFSSTANFGTFFGSGAPTLSAAKGSLYLRSNGSTTNDRAYINTDGGTTWTAITTAA